MQEKEWKDKRNLAKGMLQTTLVNLQDTKDSETLLGAEIDYCDIVKYQIRALLNFWDERSIVSRMRFVEGVEDG